MERRLSKISEHVENRNALTPETKQRKKSCLNAFGMIIVVLTIVTLGFSVAAASPAQKGFETPEEAFTALIAAVKDNDRQDLMAIFGPEANELISSGDDVADQHRRQMFIDNYIRKNSIRQDGDRKILLVGEREWPFPVPLVKKKNMWFFDTAAGKEEILNRRIGRNELDAIQTMLAIVDAEREYALKDRDGDNFLEYARKFRSDPGKRNGLYWETKDGEEPSPLGELIAKAKEEGYTGKGSKEEPEPYHGYYYRILTAEGKNAGGGAYDYIVNGKMIGGFAVVAYPARYGNSGVMTFIVNYDGVVYQKNLGKDTERIARKMKRYDPDKTWERAEDIRKPQDIR